MALLCWRAYLRDQSWISVGVRLQILHLSLIYALTSLHRLPSIPTHSTSTWWITSPHDSTLFPLFLTLFLLPILLPRNTEADPLVDSKSMERKDSGPGSARKLKRGMSAMSNGSEPGEVNKQ